MKKTQEKYMLSRPRYSTFLEYEVVDILRRRRFLFIYYWTRCDTIRNVGDTQKIIYYLNNPDKLKEKVMRFLESEHEVIQ